jgi:hypothetical protein
MSLTLQTTGGRDLDEVVASVLERFASDAGIPSAETLRLMEDVRRIVEREEEGPVRVAFALDGDAIDIEIERDGSRPVHVWRHAPSDESPESGHAPS